MRNWVSSKEFFSIFFKQTEKLLTCRVRTRTCGWRDVVLTGRVDWWRGGTDGASFLSSAARSSPQYLPELPNTQGVFTGAQTQTDAVGHQRWGEGRGLDLQTAALFVLESAEERIFKGAQAESLIQTDCSIYAVWLDLSMFSAGAQYHSWRGWSLDQDLNPHLLTFGPCPSLNQVFWFPKTQTAAGLDFHGGLSVELWDRSSWGER